MGPNSSPSALPRLHSDHQAYLGIPDGHMGSGLIGAVHLPNPFSHTSGHMGGVLHHMDHVHGQPGPLIQNPEGMGGFKMAEGVHGMRSTGSHPGGNGFGFNPYVEAPSNSQALNDLEVANLHAFLESMDSDARADLMNGQHFQQHFPQQQQMQWPAVANCKFEPCD